MKMTTAPSSGQRSSATQPFHSPFHMAAAYQPSRHGTTSTVPSRTR